MSAIQTIVQEATIDDVFRFFVNSYRLPNEMQLVRWESNYDPRTGKVWFKLFAELPEPENNKIITLKG